MGQLGTTSAVDIPDSHNAGDFGYSLIDAPHPYRITRQQYERDLTDGHLDVDFVRKGPILIAPVKVKGGESTLAMHMLCRVMVKLQDIQLMYQLRPL